MFSFPVEAAGGKALPCIVNVREEEQIAEAVNKAVQTYGGIDVLVNNASAISLTGTLETPTKKVDLMMSANTRGTYLTSPGLYRVSISTDKRRAYTISKYGMSMCVLGMSEEFRGEVAVNALWPQTAIYTSAMDMLGGAGVEKQCRKTDILADAAYCILTKPKSFTGNFVIDEHLLREEGIKNFDVYAVAPGHPLLPDFFLDVDPDTLAMKMEAHGASPAFREGKKSDIAEHEGLDRTKPEGPERGKHHVHFAAKNSGGPVMETFKIIQVAINEEVVRSVQGVYQFELSGKLKPTMAFMSGKLTIKGDMALAIKLEKLMGQFNAKL
uniref:Uncharacterized protein n=1 Tax=Sphaerodactylus townsendi TaxID=933632 RepID=A0ACB8ETT2_9SAUR